MKAKNFGQFLEAFADILGQAGAVEQAGAWRSLSRIFQAMPSAKVSDVCKLLAGIDIAPRTGGASVQDVVALIPSLLRCLGDSAKKALVDDIKLLADALAPFANCPVLVFAEAAVARLSQPTTVTPRPPADPGTDVIEQYLRDLESALRDSARFTEVFNKLKKEIKAPAAKRIALEFTKGKARTKRDALSLIWGRHASLVGTAARAKATGGRTAA